MMTDQTNCSTKKIVSYSDTDTTNDDFPYELFKQEQEKFLKTVVDLLPPHQIMPTNALEAEDNDNTNADGASLLNQPATITTSQTKEGDAATTTSTEKIVTSNSNSGLLEPEDTFPYELFKQEQEKFMKALSKQMSSPASKSSTPPPNKANNALLFAEENRHNDEEVVGLESERIVAAATTRTTTNGPTPPTIQNVIDRQGKEIKKLQNEVELLKQQMAQMQKALHEKITQQE